MRQGVLHGHKAQSESGVLVPRWQPLGGSFRLGAGPIQLSSNMPYDALRLRPPLMRSLRKNPSDGV